MGLRDQVIKEFNYSTSLLYQIPEIPHKQVEINRREAELTTPKHFLTPNLKSTSIQEILDEADLYYQDGKLDRALIGYKGILAIDPLNESARFNVASIYEKLEDYEEQ